ncbi:MAG: hypothetical protein IKZ95_06750 [Lachnospiraceae bacterium]|nr:hypothetical protein [Lachnospiraceae bacterium]
MTGKDKCKILKEIRAEIAKKNDIEWVVKECTHQGECKGTCPRCESEVRKLERELELWRKIGKAVAVVGISTACLAGLTACHSIRGVETDLSGMIDVVESPDPYQRDGDIEVLDGEVASNDYYDDYDGEQTDGSGDEGGFYELDGDVAYID